MILFNNIQFLNDIEWVRIPTEELPPRFYFQLVWAPKGSIRDMREASLLADGSTIAQHIVDGLLVHSLTGTPMLHGYTEEEFSKCYFLHNRRTAIISTGGTEHTHSEVCDKLINRTKHTNKPNSCLVQFELIGPATWNFNIRERKWEPDYYTSVVYFMHDKGVHINSCYSYAREMETRRYSVIEY